MRACLPAADGAFAVQYLCYALDRTHAPACFHLGVALSLLASVAAHTLGIFWGTRLYANWWTILIGPSGDGKCLGRGTPVLRYDGQIVPVEAIRPGDLLMGPDSTPRRVLSTTQGRGPLYEIKPKRGEVWVCNDKHVLTLINVTSGALVDIPVNEYLRRAPNFHNTHKQFAPETPLLFPSSTSLPVDPYFLGVWLGDGTKARNKKGELAKVNITKPDPEIRKLMEDTARHYELRLHAWKSNASSECPTFALSSDTWRSQWRENSLLTELRQLFKTDDDVGIPHNYLTASVEDRRALLAGLLDTDGWRNKSGYEIVQKRRRLADDILFLARSLGLRATVRKKTVGGAPYWRIHIVGDCTTLPLRIPRKRPLPRRQIKHATHNGFTVTPLGEGDYFGFTLDGDGRFLLGDFTVTHNSSSIGIGEDILREVNPRAPVTDRPGSPQALDDLLEQEPRRLFIYSEFPEFLEQTRFGQASPLRSKMTRYYDSLPATDVYRGNKGKPPPNIQNPRLSLLAGTAPEPLAAYTSPVEWQGGFMSRFCFIHQERKRTMRVPVPDEEKRAALVAHLRYLDQEKPNTGPCVGFEDEAYSLWEEWYEKNVRAAARLPHRVRGAASRAQHVALKAALLHEFDLGTRARLGRDIPWRISTFALRPALALADLHMRSLATVGDAIAESPDMRDRQTVLRVIRATGDIGAPLAQITGESRLLSWKASRIVGSLEDEGVVRAMSGVVDKSSGEKYERYRIRKPGEPMTPIITTASSGASPGGARRGGSGNGENGDA